MIPWFRFYSEVLDDDKVLLIKSAMIRWRWVLVLCLANKGKPRGVLPPVPAIALALRISRPDTESLIRILLDRELLDRGDDGKLRPHKWNERQFDSDTSTERTQRYRDRLRDVTSAPPDTDSASASGGSPGTARRTGQPLTAKDQAQRAIAELVDVFRAIPGVIAGPKDGGVMASLLTKHGQERVRFVLADQAPAISAADSPLLFLASRFRLSGKRPGVSGETVDERARRIHKELDDRDAALGRKP